MRRIGLIVLALCAIPASAGAQTPDHSTRSRMCDSIAHLRVKAAHRHSFRATGRDICTRGVYRNGHVWKASRHEQDAYHHQLRKLAAPAPPFLSAHAGHPRHGAAGVYTLHYRPVGLASCIVYHESRGNPQADNGSHKGLAQWSQEAWYRMGGGRYGANPRLASVDEQLLILSYGLVHWGCRDWCPFDPC